MPWFITVLTSVGSSVVTCIFMEAYQQRRGQDEMGNYDKGLE
jgi:hypothetical protein